MSQTRTLRTAAGLFLVALLALSAACGNPTSGTPKTAAQAPQGAAAAPATGSVTPPGDAAVPPSPAREPSFVAATVDGRPITVREVYGLAAAYRQQYDQRGISISPQQEMELLRMSLQTLINSDLMARTAKAEGKKADPNAIEDVVKKNRAQFKTEAEYKQALAASGTTEDMIRKDLETQYLANIWARSRTDAVKADEAAARKFYEANKDRFKKSDEAHVQQILVASSPSDPQAKRDEARKKAEEAYAKAKAGEDFGKLAAKYSDAPNAAGGGDVGFFERGTMFREFEENAFTVPVGQVSPVFETAPGFNVVKVLERRAGQPLTFDEVKERLTEQLTANLKGQALEAKIAEIRSKAKVSILAPELELRSAPPVPAEGGAPGSAKP